MEEKYVEMNRLLVHLFNDILKIEEKALTKDAFKDISVTDMHVIEAISCDAPKNMSQVAKILNVTVGTLTIAVNNLVKKGYVKRVRSTKDKRIVLISLTAKGQKAYKHHEKFHDKMIKDIVNELQNDEIDALNRALSKINNYMTTLQDNN